MSRIIFVLLFAVTFSSFVFSQIEPPKFSHISVDPETNELTFGYYASPSVEATDLYFLYVKRTNPTIQADDIYPISGNTDDLITLAYNDFNNKFPFTEYSQSIRFAIRAQGGTITSSDFDRYTHKTIFTSSDYHECEKAVKLSWNNYEGANITLVRNRIFKQNLTGTDVLIKEISADSTEYSVPVAYTSAEQCFYIQSEIIDDRGNTHLVTSNKTCQNISGSKTPPRFMNADYATSTSDDNIELSFTIDELTDIINYKLWHSTDNGGPFEAIDSVVLGVDAHPFIFNHSERGVALERNFYALVAYDQCGDSILSSNIASNIVLTLQEAHISHDLEWNRYYIWNGDVENHYVMRQINDGEFEQIGSDNWGSEILNYSDELGALIHKGADFCYYILAKEENNPYVANATALSNKVCIVREARIFIPNTFNPLSEVEENRKVTPQGSFFNINDYHFIIWNRFDVVMFESETYGEGWDGTFKGKEMPEGVYMFKLTIDHPDGPIERKGGITLKYGSR